jgi:hypothetical protein
VAGICKHRAGKSLAILLVTALLALGISACGGSTDTNSLAGPNSRGVPIATNPFHLQEGGKSILDSGSRVSVDPKAVTGYIDGAIPEKRENVNVVSLSGWAASGDLSRAAEAVVAFVGTKAVAALKPTGERPDVAEGYNKPGLKRIGFVLSVPVASLDCSAPAEGLQIFGIVGKGASALTLLENVGQIIASACPETAPHAQQ